MNDFTGCTGLMEREILTLQEEVRKIKDACVHKINAELRKIKLKPCPFCGKKASIAFEINPGNPDGALSWYKLLCPTEACLGCMYRTCSEDSSPEPIISQGQVLARKWNTREGVTPNE